MDDQAQPDPPAQARLNLQVPPELVNGAFADFVGVWHNPYGFTIDFGVFGMAMPDADGQTVLPTTIVARVKVPPGLIFQIAQAIAENVDNFERTYGPITPRPTDGSNMTIPPATGGPEDAGGGGPDDPGPDDSGPGGSR